MRATDDLRNHLLMFKDNIDEHYKLLVPEIRHGIVLYMNIDLANPILTYRKLNSEIGLKAGKQTVMQT